MSPRKYYGLDKVKGGKEDPMALEKLFNRKFSVKHGWKCYIIERSQVAQAGINNVNGTTYSTRPFENRRATTFFSLRENVVDQTSSDFKSPRTKSHADGRPSERKTGGKENIEDSPRGASAPKKETAVPSPKRTIMRRREVKKEETIFGNCVVSAVYSQGFKVKFSMTQHNYANGIETMF